MATALLHELKWFTWYDAPDPANASQYVHKQPENLFTHTVLTKLDMLHKLMGKHVMWDIGDGTRARTRSPELPLPVSAPEAGTARPANAPKPALGLLLALYNANVTTDWVAVAKAAARIPIRAIIPVPGVTPPDPDWAPMYPSPSAYRRGVAMLRSAGVEVFAYTHLRNLSRPCCTCCGNLTQLDTWLDRIEGSADFDGVMLDNMDAAWSSAQPYHPDGLHEMYLPAAAMVRRRGLGVWANGPHVAHNGSAERPAPAWRAYLELVTLTTIFEIPVDTWLAMPPHVNFSSALQWPSSRLGGYVLRLPDNATAAAPLITKSLEAAVGRGLSWLYPTVKCKRAPGATHGVCTYAELPSYWTELVSAFERLNGREAAAAAAGQAEGHEHAASAAPPTPNHAPNRQAAGGS